MAAHELTDCKLDFLGLLLQIPVKVPLNAVGFNGLWFEHHSTASILCTRRDCYLFTGYKVGKANHMHYCQNAGPWSQFSLDGAFLSISCEDPNIPINIVN